MDVLDLRPFLSKGDLVQLTGGPPGLVGCLMVVTSITPFGPAGTITIPRPRGQKASRFYHTASWEDVDWVGQAEVSDAVAITPWDRTVALHPKVTNN